MKTLRERLDGNFVCLRDVVGALGVGITVTVDEIDGRRSLNHCKDDNSAETKVERALIGRMLREARAAEKLLLLLTGESDTRPKWYYTEFGYEIPDDTVGREGLNILIDWAKLMLPPTPRPMGRKWSAEPVETKYPFEVPRSVQIGFHADELIHFLDFNGVKHALGDALNPPSESLKTGSPKDAPSAARPAEAAEPKVAASESVVEASQQDADANGLNPDRSQESHGIVKHQITKRGRVRSIGEEIDIARRAVPKERRGEREFVWNELVKMTDSGDYQRLIRIERDVIHWKKGALEGTYTYDSLGRHLRETPDFD